MKQPELGRKIAELRKAKGLTQEELVDQCNLSVRTLQRIEAGDVTPRSHTIRVILDALDYPAEGPLISASLSDIHGKSILNLPGQFYRKILDLLNLKTNTMKKISILSVVLFALLFGLFALSSTSKAQEAQKAVEAIKKAEVNLNRWLSLGQIDSVLTLYRADACVIPFSCGKKEMYRGLLPLVENGYVVKEYTSTEISIADSLAVEKYSSVYHYMGRDIKQQGMKEWRLTNGRWLIVNHMMMDYE